MKENSIEPHLSKNYTMVQFFSVHIIDDEPGVLYAGGAGSLAAAGLVVILSMCLTIYGISSFKEGDPSTAPALTLTGRKKVPDQLQTADGWAKFTGGFFFGGISGVTWAYFLLYVLDLPYFVK